MRRFGSEINTRYSGMKINVPEGAFYVFPDVPLFRQTLNGTEIKMQTVAMYLLSQANVATVTGSTTDKLHSFFLCN
jgi:aspartate aminotransferase